MNIINLPFEEPLIIDIQGEKVQVIAFKTQEHDNIKFGIKAPRSVEVHREEVHQAIKLKNEQSTNLKID